MSYRFCFSSNLMLPNFSYQINSFRMTLQVVFQCIAWSLLISLECFEMIAHDNHKLTLVCGNNAGTYLSDANKTSIVQNSY